ncbi:MAG: preprotein translocase subunit SecG [Deinococcales bacterium]
MVIIFWLALILFLIISLLLAGVILLQEPKQAGLGDAFGGGGGGDYLNVGGVTSGLHNVTVWLGIIWGLLALLIAVLPRA